MSHFIKNGNTYHVSAEGALDIHKTLPVGTYVVKQDPMSGEYFLEQVDDLTVSGKLYGNTVRDTDRILTTFKSRVASTGVLLSGEKGSGKSLLAKYVAVKAADDGIPTIMINSPFFGDRFNMFIQSIEQSCVIIFDEFEKVYDREDQGKLLTLLDGVFPTKKLFMLTCNETHRVNTYMDNRPGRVFYHFKYDGLEQAFIREYCDDELNDKSMIEQVVNLSALYRPFNFDMLKAVVEEVNRYGENPFEAVKFLNIGKSNREFEEDYTMELFLNGEKVTLWRDAVYTDPMSNSIRACHDENPEDSESDTTDYSFDRSHLVSIDAASCTYIFEDTDENAKLILKRKPVTRFDYSKLF